MEALGIDPKMIIAQIINFALLFFLFKKYMVPHLKAFVQKRREEEEKSAMLLSDLQKEKDAMQEERESFNTKLKSERTELLKMATKEADMLKANLVEKNAKEVDGMVSKAKQAIAAEKEQFEKELENKLTTVVANVLDKGFKDILPKTAQSEILEHINKTK
jgi:F-type H+-transporting ATPase subunit b